MQPQQVNNCPRCNGPKVRMWGKAKAVDFRAGERQLRQKILDVGWLIIAFQVKINFSMYRLGTRIEHNIRPKSHSQWLDAINTIKWASNQYFPLGTKLYLNNVKNLLFLLNHILEGLKWSQIYIGYPWATFGNHVEDSLKWYDCHQPV